MEMCIRDSSMADSMQATNAKAYQYTFMDFRSRGLLLHPLYNANVISIFMEMCIRDRVLFME